MKKTIISLIASGAIFLCSSCEEFQPVFTLKYDEPLPQEVVSMSANCTIADLAKQYSHGNVIADMSENDNTVGKIIAGRVSSNDQPGNFYKTMYIQDETGGIELKIGKNGLYNFYKPGQMVYVLCEDLALGEYGAKYDKKSGALTGSGMVQIGFNGEGTKYETSYIEMQYIIDSHIFPGDPEDIVPVTPILLTEAQLPGATATLENCPYIGKLVTLKGLTYGGVNNYGDASEAFALIYIDSAKDGKQSSNRIFISGTGTHLTTWGLSQQMMDKLLTSGVWDNVNVGNSGDYNYGKVGDPRYAYQGYGTDDKGKEYWDTDDAGQPIKTYPGIDRSAVSVSQYFTMGNTLLAIRTSGYCKFADAEVPAEVLNGSKSIEVTGILTLYEGSIQITVNDIKDIKVE